MKNVIEDFFSFTFTSDVAIVTLLSHLVSKYADLLYLIKSLP